MSLNVCDIDPDLKTLIHKFRFRKETNNAAIIMKVIAQNHEIILQEELLDLQDMEELRDSIPDTQPRFVLLSWCITHGDGRVSYPMAFIFTTPRDCQPQLQMMYAGSYNQMIKECDLTKVFQIRDVEELNNDWIEQNLVK